MTNDLKYRSVWEERFEERHRRNPAVYKMFYDFTMQLIAAGRKRTAVHVIIGRMRWETALRDGSHFKIGQNYGKPMALKFARENPQYKDVFEFRTRGDIGESYDARLATTTR